MIAGLYANAVGSFWMPKGVEHILDRILELCDSDWVRRGCRKALSTRRYSATSVSKAVGSSWMPKGVEHEHRLTERGRFIEWVPLGCRKALSTTWSRAGSRRKSPTVG